jgi:hypothetical protein
VFRRGLAETWTSCDDIGKKESHGHLLSTAEYLDVEGRYVESIRAFIDNARVPDLCAYNVEFWDMDNSSRRDLGLDDVFDGSSVPEEGAAIPPERLENIFRRCLREVAWLEIGHRGRFLIHFGYDLRVIIATDADPDEAIRFTRDRGLFIYDGNSRLPTLDRWRGLTPL